MNAVFLWPSRHAADGTKKQPKTETEEKGSCLHGKPLRACEGKKSSSLTFTGQALVLPSLCI